MLRSRVLKYRMASDQTGIAADRRSFVAAQPTPAELLLAYAVLAAGDVLLTTWILSLGGIELNAIADRVLQQFGPPGLAVLKLATMVVVLACVSAIWLKSERTGRRVAAWGVGLSMLPIVVAVVQLGAKFSPLAMPMRSQLGM